MTVVASLEVSPRAIEAGSTVTITVHVSDATLVVPTQPEPLVLAMAFSSSGVTCAAQTDPGPYLAQVG